MITESAAYAVLSVVKSAMTYLYESGHGWEDNPDIEGVYLTLCLRHIEILQPYRYFGLECSNGRCPGCDYIKTRGDLVSIDCILLGAVKCFI